MKIPKAGLGCFSQNNANQLENKRMWLVSTSGIPTRTTLMTNQEFANKSNGLIMSSYPPLRCLTGLTSKKIELLLVIFG
jgi:hypothetical protein